MLIPVFTTTKILCQQKGSVFYGKDETCKSICVREVISITLKHHFQTTNFLKNFKHFPVSCLEPLGLSVPLDPKRSELSFQPQVHIFAYIRENEKVLGKIKKLFRKAFEECDYVTFRKM